MKRMMDLLKRAFGLLKIGALLVLAGVRLVRQLRQGRSQAQVTATEQDLPAQPA